jgi:hypothetical protein
MSQSSISLNNLRAVLILIVVAFHSCLPYLASAPTKIAPFDQAPYDWLAFPVVEARRSLAFDLFCAWNDVSLMAMLFVLSGLFAAPSLMRKGTQKYLSDRVWRIAVPFVLALIFLNPLALYPAYALRAAHPGLTGYVRAWTALPFWPNGPAWFRWLLFVFNALAALLHFAAPRILDRLARASAWVGRRPRLALGLLVAASALAYAPLAMAFSPWRWSAFGPFSLQLCRPALYAVSFFAAFAIGVAGMDCDLFRREGLLARRWALWLAVAVVSFLLWAGLTSLTLPDWFAAPFVARLAASIAYALACPAGVLFLIAVCLRFAGRRIRLLDSVAANAYGVYLAHYVFVVWLPFVLLRQSLPVTAKAAIVFGGSLALSWASAIGWTRLLKQLNPAAGGLTPAAIPVRAVKR